MENCEITGPYVVLPSHILDDDTLSDSEKILFAEISGLCHKEGYCFASNDYLAQRHHCTKITISRWISKLVSRGYLISKIVNNNQRRLYLADVYHRNQGGLSQMIMGVITNDRGGVITNDIHNNKEYNSKTNIKSNIKEIYKEKTGFTISRIDKPLHNLNTKKDLDAIPHYDPNWLATHLAAHWNIRFSNTNVPLVKKITKERVKGVNARFEDGYTVKELEEAIDIASKSDWCTSGKWGFGFDWVFCYKKNIQKVLEGNYNQKPKEKIVNQVVEATYDDPDYAELWGKETPKKQKQPSINCQNKAKLDEMKHKALGAKYD